MQHNKYHSSDQGLERNQPFLFSISWLFDKEAEPSQSTPSRNTIIDNQAILLVVEFSQKIAVDSALVMQHQLDVRCHTDIPFVRMTTILQKVFALVAGHK